MSTALNNVISFQTGKKETSVGQAIRLILKGFESNSEGTSSKYQKHMEEFIMFVLGLTLENVDWEDLLSITYQNSLEYVDFLKDKGNSNRTINAKIAALKSLYKELAKINNSVNTNAVNIKQLNTKEEEHKNSYGALTEEEVEALFEYCKTLPRHHKPLTKELFFKTSYITAIRKNALLGMTWGDLKQVTETNGQVIWTIQLFDKGKMDTTPISDNFYNELMQLKTDETKLTDRIFQIKEEGLATTLKNFCKLQGISEDRKIVIHSLKKASIDKVYKESGDLLATARHAHHNGIELVYKTYQGKNTNLTQRASFSLMEDKKDISVLQELTKEELIKLIEGNCSAEQINKMILDIKA